MSNQNIVEQLSVGKLVELLQNQPQNAMVWVQGHGAVVEAIKIKHEKSTFEDMDTVLIMWED